MQAARDAAAREGWSLVQDVDGEGYEQVPRDIYAGYTVLAREMTEAMEAPPTHVIVNAGVGGLASAVCAHPQGTVRRAAPAVCRRGAERGRVPAGVGRAPASASRCRPSRRRCRRGWTAASPAIAWRVLASGADDFVSVPDDVALRPVLGGLDRRSPPASAVAGLGVLVAAAAQPALAKALDLGPAARVAVIVCEGAIEDRLEFS